MRNVIDTSRRWRLHGDSAGAISLSLLFTILVLWALLAMVWNTGQVISTKMRLQAAADIAAYDAAVCTSRTTNLIAASNMLIVRTISAEAMARARWWTAGLIAANWIATCKWSPMCWMEVGLIELPVWTQFLAETGSVDTDALTQRVEELHAFQKQLRAATPEAIEARRAALAAASKCAIHLTQVQSAEGHSEPNEIYAPVRDPRPKEWTVLATHVLARLKQDREGWEDGLSLVGTGKGPASWRVATAFFAFNSVYFKHSDHFTVIATQGDVSRWLPMLEGRVDDESRRKWFTVTAAASRRGQFEPSAIMPGLFRAGVNPDRVSLAIAQAETFNPYDYPYNWVYRVLETAPWRVWTKLGWNWQPRLAVSDALIEAAQRDPALESLLRSAGIDANDPELSDAILH